MLRWWFRNVSLTSRGNDPGQVRKGGHVPGRVGGKHHVCGKAGGLPSFHTCLRTTGHTGLSCNPGRANTRS